jgi:hypothetical protein
MEKPLTQLHARDEAAQKTYHLPVINPDMLPSRPKSPHLGIADGDEKADQIPWRLMEDQVLEQQPDRFTRAEHPKKGKHEDSSHIVP